MAETKPVGTDVKTTELALAAYLQVKGYKIKEIKSDGNGQAVFIFENTPELQQDIVGYSNSEFARFEASLRALRKIVYTLVKKR